MYFLFLNHAAGILRQSVIRVVLQIIEPKPEIKKPTSDKKKKQFIFFLGSEN